LKKGISANYKKDIDTLQQIPPEEKDFEKALQMVQSLVKDAEENEITIIEKELSADEFKTTIMNGNVAIILLNSLIYACLECHSHLYDNHDLSHIPTHVDPTVGAPYRGHYVLICGYNKHLDAYLYKNPDGKQPLCYMPTKIFEKSRKSFGTQHNVVFINLFSENLEQKYHDHEHQVNGNLHEQVVKDIFNIQAK